MNRRSLFYRSPTKNPDIIRRKRWNVWRILGTALRRTCIVLGAILLIWVTLSTIVYFTVMGGANNYAPMPDKMVVVLKLDEGLAEKPGAPTLTNPFPYLKPTLHDVIARIDEAAKDERVQGFVFSLKSGGVTLTQVQELRAAIARFRQSGKFTIFYTPSFADYGQGLSLYYLASAFEQIWMQPIGMLAITGVSLEMPYARTALDKIGAKPEFFQREEYKGAMENLTNKSMTGPSRETYTTVVNDFSEQMMSAIAKDRKMSRSVVKQYVDLGLLSGDEALKDKLIDRLDYGDVMVDELTKQVTGHADSEDNIFVALSNYRPKRAPAVGKTQVALIQAVGMIVPGTSKNSTGAAADDVAAAIYEAGENENIKGILLRIDSPGGSPSASETIRRAIIKAKEQGKMIVVSMGAVAASGGYWIAAPADYIVANPATLTGSIGVVMGKFSLAGLWDKLGIKWEGVSYGENADLWSINKPLDAQASARMNDLIDDTYNAFLQRVAEGRNMSMAQARAVAKGRAWTGAQALDKGLVDALGGQTDALDYMATQLGGIDRHDLHVMILPREKRPIERLMELVERQSAMSQWFMDLRTQLGALSSSRMHAVESLGLFQ